ncbi:MAG TPA: SDR family oxidoreductase [Candidatus Limnocylindria bacterium]|nr:SDR family oxidoreductase [Candidatus Limnocylindria bacterium]
MGVIAISGSASGIGAALRQRLERAGDTVLGIDLRDAEIVADLGTRDGRAAAIAATRAAAPGRLDGLVTCAGIGPQVPDWPLIVSLDYFGSQALLDGLRDLLARARGAAVAISSNSSTISPWDADIVAACLAGDEARARERARSLSGQHAYASAKRAIACFVRRSAPQAAWAGAGIRLNAVAPGAVATPLLQQGLDDPVYGPAIRGFPIPLGGFGSPEQIAAVAAFLLGPESSFFCGSVLIADGGSDALLRPDAY